MLNRKISAATAFLLLWSTITGVFSGAANAANSTVAELLPYFNAALPVETRVADLLSRMTLDEKLGQMVQAERASVTADDVKTYQLGSVLSGGGSFPNGKQSDSTRENWAELVDSYQAGALSTRLGIPILYGVDAVHGQNNLIGATLFPHNIGLGAARNPELVKQIGAAVAQEVKASGTNWTFAPTMADPQNINWGRTYEGFGDNQSLVAQMAAAYIQGLQGTTIGELKNSDRVVATAKHFLGEGLADNGSNQGNVSTMTEQEVIDLNLPMYKAAIEAGARTVMASYSSIQGLKMHANKRLLTDALKGTGEGQLGFTGFVISDYNAVQQITKDWNGNAVSGLKDQIRVAVNAGVDMMMMPSDWKSTLDHLKALAGEGAITQERIDDAVTRILRVKFESGLFEHPMTDKSLETTFGSESHRKLARQAVSESLVLLKNDKVNGQPILSQLKDMGKIFIAGKSAVDIGRQAGGWSITWQGQEGNITPGTTILQGIKNAVGESKTVTYNKHGRGAAGHDVAIAIVGEKPYAEGNGDSLNGLKLDNEDIATLNNIRESGVPTIVVLLSGRPMMINDQLGDWAGLVEAWLPGTEGQGVADVLFGDNDFKGKLPVRWPFYTEAYTNPVAGASNLEQQYILFDYGYGLTKDQATPTLPTLPPAPEDPDKAPYVKVRAEHFTQKSAGLKLEDSKDIGGGQDVGYTAKGEWLEYRIDVPQSGTFDVDFRYAGNSGTAGLKIINEAGDTIGTLTVESTGDWQNWMTKTVNGVVLNQGVQKIKLEFTSGGMNLNWFGSTGFSPASSQGGGSGGTVTPQPVVQPDAVENWLSTERDSKNIEWYYAPRWQAGDKQLEQQPNIDLTEIGVDADVTTIDINPNKTYQSIMGMGSSMEESTVYNLMKMSPAKQEELLKKLVSKTDGIGMSMIRVTIGTADFTAQQFYTYDDLPPGETDPTLSRFSIQKDIDYGIIPTLQKIKAINPEVKFFASPWSPPGWMKTSDSMIRGQVKDEYLPVLADYYVKYIQAYKALGIDIEAMTLQNEPLLEIDYPSTKMPWEQEAELAKLLKQKLIAAGLNVKLWIFDHNPGETMVYPAQILALEENRAVIDGTAFHDYGGDLALMTQLHDLYPDKNVYLTERAVWGTEGADQIAQYYRNWARSYNSWVVMLDSDINTHQWVGTPDPTMLVQDSSDPDNYWLTPEYYFLGQFSKFVEPDYVRIDSNYGSTDKVTNVAFMSPDKKTIVTVVINRTNSEQTFKLVSDGTQIAATLPAKSVATYRWGRLNVNEPNPGNEIVLSLSPDHLPYGVDGQEIMLVLSGGAFEEEHVGEISLSGEATTKGVSVSSVTYMNSQEVKVTLAWDGKTAYYGDLNLTVNVPLSAYSDSTGGKPLIGNVKLLGTVNKSDAIVVPGTITAGDYYRLSGVTADMAAGKLKGFGADRWAEFNINVPDAGTYVVTVKATSPGSSFLLKTADGTTIASYNIPFQYDSNSIIGARTSVELQAGEQLVKLVGNSGAFDFKEMIIEAIEPLTAGGDGVLKVEAESFIKAGQNVIQYGEELTNLGYMVAGTYLDYLVTVPQTGYYKVQYRYATEQGGVSVSMLLGLQSIAKTSLQSTSNWGNYKIEASTVVHLDAGTHTIRLLDNGDGFNLDWFQLSPTTDAPTVVFDQAAAPRILVQDGQRGDEQIVTLATNIVGAEIYYTTDGTLPTSGSTLYTEPVVVTPSVVIRAIVVKEGMIDSFVSFYAIAAASPKADLASGTYNSSIHVTLTSKTVDAIIYYTTDGTVPTTTSSLYHEPIKVNANATIKAMAVKDGMNHSAIAEYTYSISDTGTNPGTNPGSYTGTVPVEHTSVIKAPKPVVDPITGRATTKITAADLKAALEAAKPSVKGVRTVSIEVEELAGQTAYEIFIPAANVSTNTMTSRLEVLTGIGKVVLPSNMLRAADLNGEEMVGLTIALADTSKLDAAIRAQLGNRPVIELTLRAGNQVVAWNNPESPVTVSIPYKPSAAELTSQEHITIWYIDGQGNLVSVPSGRYDNQTGMVTFTTTHFSQFAVAYVNKTFADISQFKWAQQAIEVMASKGVILGTSNTTFAPQEKVRRADFIVLLVRALSLTASVDGNFADVKSSAYYADAIAIAKKLGIVQGIGNNQFAPETNITRQEMMTLAARALSVAEINVKAGSQADLAKFKDSSKIASFAVESVATLVKNGIVTGDGANVNPRGNATRAETAMIIYKLYNLQ